MHGRVVLNLGAAARTKPLCEHYGWTRGKPIDRYYIEAFLERHSADVRGRVLEVAEDMYSKRFGGARVTQQDILHIEQGHPGATITGDLTQPGVLLAGAFDCIIATQTLQFIYDIAAAVDQLHGALRPGGVLLITVPGITSVDPGEKDSWYWSLTEHALRRLLSGPFEPGKVEVTTHGNLFAATSFLFGASVQEVSKRKLDKVDLAYPVTVAARAVA